MKPKTFLYHLLFWGSLYLLWIIVFRSYSVAISKTMTIEFCYLIFITIDYYTINNLAIPYLLQQKKYPFFIAAIVFTIAISAWLRALVSQQMNLHFFHFAQGISLGTLYFNSAINISIWVLLITLGKLLLDRIQTQQQLEQLETIRVQTELDYLKAQINPHALFNSLNTIYGHIDKSNQVARNILLQFSELLRYQLYDCGEEKVCLNKELAYIKNYIDFQRLRKEEELLVTLHIKNGETDLKIAPLLLIVLIENAFKFVSTFPDKENKITIEISIEKNTLYSSFINTKEKQPTYISNNSNGIGITNLKRRLELLYPDQYTFITTEQDELYQTNLTIDLT